MGIFPGHQGGAGGRAGWIDMKIRQARGLGMEPVELGRPDHRVAVGRDVAVAHVINENDDNVGLLLGGGDVSHERRRSQ